MNKLFVALALATVVASPALAASKHHGRAYHPYGARAQGGPYQAPAYETPYYAPSSNEYWHDQAKGSPG